MNESWQEPLDTWKSRLSVLHDLKYMTDCKFVLNDGPDRLEIKSHKLILAACSSEFLNLYFLNGTSNYDEIIVRDVTPAALTAFIDYCYNEKTDLTMNIIWDVLKLARLYAVKSLERFCERYFVKNVNKENVLTILDKSLIYGLVVIKTTCMDIISKLTEEFYKEPAFYLISPETLKVLLNFDEIPGKEIEIYHAVIKWSEIKCEKSNIEKTSANKRLVLDNCLDEIRFCSMTGAEFNSCVDDSILSKDEMFDIFRNIASNGGLKCKFSSLKRTSIAKLSQTRKNNSGGGFSFGLSGFGFNQTSSNNNPIGSFGGFLFKPSAFESTQTTSSNTVGCLFGTRDPISPQTSTINNAGKFSFKPSALGSIQATSSNPIGELPPKDTGSTETKTKNIFEGYSFKPSAFGSTQTSTSNTIGAFSFKPSVRGVTQTITSSTAEELPLEPTDSNAAGDTDTETNGKH